MLLLNTQSQDLEVFATNEEVRYAILSHTWGSQEVTLADFLANEKRTGSEGWDKICRSSEVAARLGFDYLWVDTFCIDKSSSSELSEAINSMFQWYEKAGICIAYLEDVSSADDPTKDGSQFAKCRWFSRGWTLQELIAPPEVHFYSQEWELIGTRTSLQEAITRVSLIPAAILHTSGQQQNLDDFSIAEKMSWAANRQTTRPEDMAYCLLGLFDINMPLLYGEGRVKAFKRLQEEIIKSTNDDSIYAWRYPEDLSKRQHFWGLLAESPAAFGHQGGDYVIKRARYLTRSSNYVAAVSSRGLDVELALTPHPRDESGTIFIAVLDCDMGRDEVSHELTPAIILQKTQWHNDTEFVRIRTDHLLMVSMNRMKFAKDLRRYRLGYDRLSEAQPRQIFVPHNLSTRRSPRGILFHPEVVPLHHDKPFIIGVLSNDSDWLFDEPASASANTFPGSLNRRGSSLEGTPSDASGTYVLSFDPGSDLGATEPTQPTKLGVLELEIKQYGGWNSWRTCLVIGLEPHPPNPLGTPSLYTVPWYAFVKKDKVAAGQLDDVLAREDRVMEHKLLNEVLRVEFDLESRHSRLHYNVILKLREATKESRR
ncbi:heterokaryon incompatibility domain-containing protein [Trichoderma sp. SZMC 28014]